MILSRTYRNYALAALTLLYGINLLDRGLMYILLQPIKEDLTLSDTQVGFVTGIAFALFYATAGVPIGRWADRGNRVTITALAMALWSLTTMAMTGVTSFVQLLVVRIAAGVGDAGCQPPIYSLLGDYFPAPAERTRALYVFEAASPVAGLIAFLGAGWLNEHFGWRVAFLLIGLPGLFLAVLVKLSLKDPRQSESKDVRAQPVTPFASVLAMLWRQSSCRNLTIAMVLIFTLGQGVVGWEAAFMIRVHGMGTAELGLWMGLIGFFGPLLGLAIGATVLNRWFAERPRIQMRLAALAVASSLPGHIAFLLASDKYHALLILIPNAILNSAFVPSIFVVLQRLVPNNMRASVMTLMLLFANLVGMGLGPLSVGMLSDLLAPRFGNDGLRYAMMLVSGLALWAGWHLWRAGDTVGDDIRDADIAAAAMPA